MTAAAVLAATAAGADPGHERTLARLHDPVVIRTSQLFGFGDAHTDHYRLYSLQEGELVAVPFQFDERDGDDLRLEDSAFVFDGDDELVFMAKDAGARAAVAQVAALGPSAREIEVVDPRDGARAWVYLLHFSAEFPALSPVTYARFDAARDRAETDFYAVDHAPGRNFLTGMYIKPALGGRGGNILDRTKLRVVPTLSLLFVDWSPMFTEEDFTERIDGLKVGPVRVIRRVRQSLDLGRFFPDMPGGTVYTYYYATSYVTPLEFRAPSVILKALRSFRFTGASDFRSDVVGMTYWDSANPEGLHYSGGVHGVVNTTEDHDWWAVSGKGGTCLHTFFIPSEWIAWGITRGTIFSDDANAVEQEGNEAERGSHEAGFSLQNMQNLRHGGNYRLALSTFFLPHSYHPGDEHEALDVFHQPLQTTVLPGP